MTVANSNLAIATKRWENLLLMAPAEVIPASPVKIPDLAIAAASTISVDLRRTIVVLDVSQDLVIAQLQAHLPKPITLRLRAIRSPPEPSGD